MRYGNFIVKRCGPSLLFYVGYSIYFSRLLRNIYAFSRLALCYSSLLLLCSFLSRLFSNLLERKGKGKKEKNRRQEERKKKTFPLFSPTAQPESLFFFSPRRETENNSTPLHTVQVGKYRPPMKRNTKKGFFLSHYLFVYFPILFLVTTLLFFARQEQYTSRVSNVLYVRTY